MGGNYFYVRHNFQAMREGILFLSPPPNISGSY